MTWREPEMQRDLGNLMDAWYPPAERSPETSAALDQIMNGETEADREAGREAFIESMGGLPPEEDEDEPDYDQPGGDEHSPDLAMNDPRSVELDVVAAPDPQVESEVE